MAAAVREGGRGERRRALGALRYQRQELFVGHRSLGLLGMECAFGEGNARRLGQEERIELPSTHVVRWIVFCCLPMRVCYSNDFH